MNVKKIHAIIAVLAVAVVFVFVGCQKQEVPKPVEQSAMTPTADASAPDSMVPATTPEGK